MQHRMAERGQEGLQWIYRENLEYHIVQEKNH